jgi:cysteine dioxygenase
VKDYSLEELTEFAKNYKYRELPICFEDKPYTSRPIYKDNHLEIIVICFSDGQTSSVHHHQGSNCVIRLVYGRVMETLFNRAPHCGQIYYSSHHMLEVPDTISGLNGKQIHQLANLDPNGSVIVNFYSPPFKR